MFAWIHENIKMFYTSFHSIKMSHKHYPIISYTTYSNFILCSIGKIRKWTLLHLGSTEGLETGKYWYSTKKLFTVSLYNWQPETIAHGGGVAEGLLQLIRLGMYLGKQLYHIFPNVIHHLSFYQSLLTCDLLLCELMFYCNACIVLCKALENIFGQVL